MTTYVTVAVSEAEHEVGASIKDSLEEIFGRASESLPHYEKLGKIEGIALKLHSDLKAGVAEETIESRKKVFGRNELPEEEEITFFAILVNAWSDRVIMILTAAAVVSLILGMTVPEKGESKVDLSKGWIDGFSILASVLIVTTITSVNDYRKELKFRQLTLENAALNVTVIRSGKKREVDVSDLVVGDLMALTHGLVTPCDGFFVTGQSVVIDESAVTGENDPKKKSASAPIILSGTTVNTAENCYMIVGAVGENSFGGKLLMSSRGDGTIRGTPLQERLDDLANNIGKVGMSVAAVLFIIMSIRSFVSLGRHDPNFSGTEFLDHFLLCVALVAFSVPEGLPLAVTLTLAYSQRKMQDDNNQVRRLKACEIMGNATQICSDKTGTLTQNKMSVVQGYIADCDFKVDTPGDFPLKTEVPRLRGDLLKLLGDSLALNSSSEKVVVDKEGQGRVWMWQLDKGNKTENALLDFHDRLFLNEHSNSIQMPLPHQVTRAQVDDSKRQMYPFTSDRKRMSVLVRRESHGPWTLLVKGGSEQILKMCKTMVNTDGHVVPLSDVQLSTISSKISFFASNANRTIGLAYATVNVDHAPEEEPVVDLTWFGVVGLQDPLRPEVIPAVKKCQLAGVRVRMCTGDNIDTAVAISKECGIFDANKGHIALTGSEFRQLVYKFFASEAAEQDKFFEHLNRMSVLARSQPLDKQLLVLMLMTRGEIVAVTGDGTNDAPALKLANVGFVMKSGTDIAVKSADIVLLDDNFRSVQRAVVWGRTVNDNIRKFLQMQLAQNWSATLLVFVGAISSADGTSPLQIVQLLWCNMLMDTGGALNLATELPNEECLNRGPVHRRAPLTTRRMLCTITCQVILQLTVNLLFVFYGHVIFDVSLAFEKGEHKRRLNTEHVTTIFNTIVFFIIFNQFNARKLYQELWWFEGMWRSHLMVVVVFITAGIQALAVEFGGDFVHTKPLTWKQWLISLAFALLVFPVGLLSRFIPITEPVYPNNFDEEEMDDAAKKQLAQLKDTIKHDLAQREAQPGDSNLVRMFSTDKIKRNSLCADTLSNSQRVIRRLDSRDRSMGAARELMQ